MDSISSTQEISLEQSEEELKWWPLVLTHEKTEYLWSQIQQFPQVFDDFHKGDFNTFLARLQSRENIFIDIGPDLGLAAGFGVRPGLDLVLHLVMFDRRLRGREKLFQEIMSYVFRGLKLRRMTAMVSERVEVTIKLVQRLGFKHEGTMRKAILQDGKYYDVHLYGILKEEHEALTQPA